MEFREYNGRGTYMNGEKDWTAEGFVFRSSQDARLAVEEQKKIEYLEARMDYSAPENILTIYERAIEDRVFKTPVGVFYLRRLQIYLMEQTEISRDRIPPIPLYLSYETTIRESTSPARRRIRPAEKKKGGRQQLFTVSIILNIALVIAVIAMFSITLASSQPNILNYQRVLTDRYASWEQDLTEREQAVREKERALEMGTE